MKRTLTHLILGLVICNLSGLTISASPQKQHTVRNGMSAKELAKLAHALPSLAGRIYSIQSFSDGQGNSPGFISFLLMSPKGGWYVYVFKSEGAKKFALDWESGKLDSSFDVGSPNDYKTIDIGREHAFMFTGCAAHACPEVFSVLLYAPAAHKAFIAAYVNGEITYSPGVDGPRNRTYKVVLDKEIEEQKSAKNVIGK